jgi:hypothetical protein
MGHCLRDAQVDANQNHYPRAGETELTIRLIGKDQTTTVLDNLDNLFKVTVYPYLNSIDTRLMRQHLANLRSWPGFDCSVQIGTDPVISATKIIINITPQATTPGVKQ